MNNLKNLEPQRVFYYFSELSKIPRGSENMEKISEYCEGFAKGHSLRYHRDKANNVIIYKPAAKGYEKCEPIILQGHLDMVCQKTPDSKIDFSSDPIDIYCDGEFIKARGTTLGADNGIAAAMILSILESNEISHPEIIAVFTTDEEIGMIGALELDFGLINAKRMINLDSEEEDTVTVSCAGGSDFTADIPIMREEKSGDIYELELFGLLGGHSGVEIDKGRINANILAGKFLNSLSQSTEFSLVNIAGGDKPNAIPNGCKFSLVTTDIAFKAKAQKILEELKAEIKANEPSFEYSLSLSASKSTFAATKKSSDDIIYALSCPDGSIKMSDSIEGLVETSLNLGILKTTEDSAHLHHALRSNIEASLDNLDKELLGFYSNINATTKSFGRYPAWEFKENSALQALYCETYKRLYNKAPKLAAIHAGLECGVFSKGLSGLDCIAIGPDIFDVHTVNERLPISSVQNFYNLLLEILKNSN